MQEAGVSVGGNIRIEFDRTSTSEPALQRALEEIGEHPEVEECHDHADDSHDHDLSGIFSEKTELIFWAGAVVLKWPRLKMVKGSKDYLAPIAVA